ncbi:MAG: PEGA domain-containing protein [Candidatus Methanoperedens sp.]|nr:PEGA domain-containing protein [Candidatus Methanoperedens sp.]
MDVAVVTSSLVASLLIFLYLRSIRKAKVATVYISPEIGYPKAVAEFHKRFINKRISKILIIFLVFLLTLILSFSSFMSLPITSPMTGSISVSSSPSGVSVYLDGIYQGTTPKTLTDVTPGIHTVNCKLSGYSDYEITATVTAGATATVICSLSPSGAPIIKVVSEPAYIIPGQTSVIKVTVTGKDNQAISGARIMLSSQPDGNVSPALGITDLNGQFVSTFNGIAEGKVTVRALVKIEGFADDKVDTQIEIGPPHPSPQAPINVILLFLILLAFLAASIYLITKKKEPKANSLKIPTKMYEGDSNIIVLRLAEWIALASNGKAHPLFLIDANSKKQPLGIDIPPAFSPKFGSVLIYTA